MINQFYFRNPDKYTLQLNNGTLNKKYFKMSAYWCGYNGFNQISPEEKSYISEFREIPLKRIKDIDISWSCIVLLTDEDTYISGLSGKCSVFLKKVKRLDLNLEYSKVACSEFYALFVSQAGECWQYFYASDHWKKLSDFTSVEEHTSSEKEEDVSQSDTKYDSTCNKKSKIIKISCRENVNAALDDAGVAYSIPSPIHLPGIEIMDIACGFEHCLMLDRLGRVFSWGCGMRGQLGCEVLENTSSPEEIAALGGLQVIKIAAGGWHSAAVSSDGVLYTWGWNNSGQLGFRALEESSSSTGDMGTAITTRECITVLAVPRPVDFSSESEVDIVNVSCGNRHTIALAGNGEVWGSGLNTYGQLGRCPTTLKGVDRMIKLDCPDKQKINRVICGAWNSILLCSA